VVAHWPGWLLLVLPIRGAVDGGVCGAVAGGVGVGGGA
jgi:hypothetical protein